MFSGKAGIFELGNLCPKVSIFYVKMILQKMCEVSDNNFDDNYITFIIILHHLQTCK